ncbi:MAG: hypothetical protein CMP36_04290 [Rickettsiales bacterium]|nr:hypothetical protein [Rickettsiales bacterium]|tara:strand:+ start:1538 stop:2254 length:717 start_codon:yes stop_codon:yes gene_type:complete
MIGVVTTLNKKLYKQYGHKFFDTYNWPFNLIVYSEDLNDIPNSDIVIKSIFDEIPQCEGFVNRNKTKPVADTPSGYINDGVRFSYKVYAYTNEIITNEDYKGLICIDADSVFYKMIDEDWINKHIHNDNAMMTYLGRGKHYSECGFLYFNMKHPEVINYAIEMQKMYNEDLIYKEKEQHDSYIWDLVRKRFEKNGVVNKDIGDGKVGHVQSRSILGPVYDHIKGPKRKKLMRSPEARV